MDSSIELGKRQKPWASVYKLFPIDVICHDCYDFCFPVVCYDMLWSVWFLLSSGVQDI